MKGKGSAYSRGSSFRITRGWKTYPMGGAASEMMEARGLRAHLSHAVLMPADEHPEAVCGVKTFSLCMDDSLATYGMPDCPECQRKLRKLPI